MRYICKNEDTYAVIDMVGTHNMLSQFEDCMEKTIVDR